ncbi:hypothetical protein APHCRT_1005 [Anaplasma phagocytophilum str. CRT53-1]|uniref:Uncharacterized protein n=1 Tax=Anaplasma phagocytophilum str. CRT53-1 TaxID=1359157 RepID=A0A0F3Q075_ANAPH|nr:hypothetical protein APHCRT_1005 [Anaplasma phagocytophilum str. CRT53-1]
MLLCGSMINVMIKRARGDWQTAILESQNDRACIFASVSHEAKTILMLRT